jgi:hypothetical protein
MGSALMQRLFAGMAFSAVVLLCCAGCHDGAISSPDSQVRGKLAERTALGAGVER